MRDQDLILKAETEKANKLVYNIKAPVHDVVADESALELIRFVLDTKRTEDGFLSAMVLTEHYTLLSSKIYNFSTIEEFFALVGYIVRNGIVKNR